MKAEDYRVYRFSGREWGKYMLLCTLIFLSFAKLFYDSFAVAIVGILVAPFLMRRQAKLLAKKRGQNLTLAFKDFILAFSDSLSAGYSVENAFAQAYKDLTFMYEESHDMMIECRKMINGMQNNQVIEVLLEDFAKRSGQTDVMDFATIFSIAKRAGGNMNAMIQHTAQIISEKIEVRQEIQLMFASKRMEQKIMNMVPVGIILYVRVSSPGYFDELYHTPHGIFILTICLILYLLSIFISQKIMDIEV